MIKQLPEIEKDEINIIEPSVGDGNFIPMIIKQYQSHTKVNIDVIDIGVPVISMHAPYEVISKADLYSTYEAFAAFIK
jgi:hypothetical protein